MQKVIQHDALAGGVLNTDYTGGTGQFITWKDELSNNEELLTLISERLVVDYESLNKKMRKPTGLRDLEAWQHLVAIIFGTVSNKFQYVSPT